MAIPEGIITCIPDADLDEIIAVVEVLVQEQLPSIAVPTSLLPELQQVFGSRATFGVWGVGDSETLKAAIDGGAKFAFADWVNHEMVVTAGYSAMPFYVAAMTPNEIRAVIDLGVTGALLFPADAIGHVMAPHLERLGVAERVIPMGGVGAFAAGEWAKCGSPAVCADKALLGDALEGGDLGQLRDRCESFRKAAAKIEERRNKKSQES